MCQISRLSWVLLAQVVLAAAARSDDHEGPPDPVPPGNLARVYGEWRIHVKPDRGPDYNRLIEQSGLPLFREAGGRMVGWWSTLIGDLYEHVTLWEYDDMAAFERAIAVLGKNPDFARFVAARDPLLAAEESRFLRLVPDGLAPSLPDHAPFVVHEIHRVPLARKEAYLAYMTKHGLGVLKAHGFRPAGPWVVTVGRSSEITYLFRYDSLAERERLVARFVATPEGRTFNATIAEMVEEITTRMLMPAPFSLKPPAARAVAKPPTRAASPHRQQIAPGIHIAGFADRYRSANCGWVALGSETLLIDLPRGIPVHEFLALVAATTGKPPRTLALTNIQNEDHTIIRSLIKAGVTRVVITPATHTRLIEAKPALDPANLCVLAERTPIGDPAVAVEFLPSDRIAVAAGAAVWVPGQATLFAGPLVVNGPRAALADSDTSQWIESLLPLEGLAARRVVPGFGSWGGPELLGRQRRFLTELRRQVGYHICQGRPHDALRDQIRLPADCFAWTPYGYPTAGDIDHVYRELTSPQAPFHGRPPAASDSRPHALVLIGDQPHEPGHIEEGLRPVFDATGVVPHFTVDVNALSAQNLAKVQLLVILRDGLMRPRQDNRTHFTWMKPEQERAAVAFVEGGGGFLNLHNALGLYPADGPYLRLVGGQYTGHGPLERFQIEVVDANHPVTQGVDSFFVADEQHTPRFDEQQIHLLLRSRSDDGKTAAAGWVREQGRGRVCHLANGHTLEALLHPMFQKLMRNAVRWCVRQETAGAVARRAG